MNYAIIFIHCSPRLHFPLFCADGAQEVTYLPVICCVIPTLKDYLKHLFN